MHLINGLHMCMRNQRKGVSLPTFGADGLKTFVQGLLTHYTLSINYITCIFCAYLVHLLYGETASSVVLSVYVVWCNLV